MNFYCLKNVQRHCSLSLYMYSFLGILWVCLRSFHFSSCIASNSITNFRYFFWRCSNVVWTTKPCQYISWLLHLKIIIFFTTSITMLQIWCHLYIHIITFIRISNSSIKLNKSSTRHMFSILFSSLTTASLILVLSAWVMPI